MNIRKVAAAFAVCVAASIGVLGVSAPAHAQDSSWGEVIAPHSLDSSWGE